MYPAGDVMANGHGMNLVEPNLEPNPLALLANFVMENLE